MADRQRRRRHTHPAQFRQAEPVAVSRISTAAGRKLRDIPRDEKALTRQRWQETAYDRIREIGELRYALNHKARAVARGRLVIREYDDDGQPVPDADDNPSDLRQKAERVLRNLRGPTGGYDAVLRAGALHDSIAGEAHLFGIEIVPGQHSWEMLSVSEVTRDGQGKVTRKSRESGADPVVIAGDSFTARYLNPDPEFSDMACSEVQSVLPILDELVALQQMKRTAIDSRLPAGLLVIAESLSVQFTGAGQDADGDESMDGGEDEPEFVELLMQHMSAPRVNKLDAASIVPLVATVPDQMVEKAAVQLVELAKPMNEWIAAEIAGNIGRLAVSLDIPPEVLTGKGPSNHWSAWNIDADFVTKHCEPVGDRLAAFLTVAYLRPTLEQFEDVPADRAVRVEIEYDASDLIAAPDPQVSARALYDRNELKGEKLRETHGFTEDDKPEQDEIVQRALYKVLTSAPATAIAAGLFKFFGVDLEPIAAVDPAADGPPPDGEKPTDPADGAPGEGTDSPTPPDTAAAYAAAERIRGLAEGALDRAIERAGSRARSYAQRHTTVRARVESLDNAEILCRLSADDWRAIRVVPEELFAGAFDPVAATVRTQVRQWFEFSRGYDPGIAVEVAELRARGLVARLDELVQQALVSPLRPGADGLRVPPDVTGDLLVDLGVAL